MRRFRWFSLLPGLVLGATLAAQQRVALDGTWSARSEPLDDAHPAPHDIQVPAAFETVFGTQFDGVVRYRRLLPLPSTKVAHVRVEFAAVATHATVFCNGTPVGEHLGGWTPFRVDLTAALKWDGQDVLEVRVDERVGHNTQGFLPIVQPHFGGIWQSVTLCLDEGPVLDRLGLSLFGGADGKLSFVVPTLGATDNVEVELQLRRDTELLHTVVMTARDGQPMTGSFAHERRSWSPADPQLYTVHLRLLQGGAERDRLERRIGFRALTTDGTRVLWNGQPLQLRGLLHWGYSPPHLAPPSDREFWHRQLVDLKARGFNTLKCCLWVPPPVVYDLCDELGILVWQEYPTWHPRLDQAHKQELRTEYAEFFQLDRNHPSVAFRSITCETGHSADFDVVKTLFEDCKAAVPDTLVVDDSSWIGWQRITDFWDEHPYGNNTWLPGRLRDFQRHLAEHGHKPLLLGECIAADTWFPREAWLQVHGDTETWWRPSCWAAQAAAEDWLRARFGAATVASLLPISLDFGLANRKFQIEHLRLTMPDAGYVVSVARDIPKCRMGLDDALGRPKWTPAEWAWHGDTMVCLDLGGPRRALDPGEHAVPVRIVHAGIGPLRGELRLSCPELGATTTFAIDQPTGSTSAPFVLHLGGNPGELTRVRIVAELTGSHPTRNHWDLWRVPTWAYPSQEDVLEVTALTPAVLDRLEAGARVLLHAGDRKGSLRTEALWFLRGAPFAPDHPVHRRLPRDLLLDLASFDLESGRTLPWDLLRDEFDPMLAFWETHDIDTVRFHLLAGDTAVGKGRLLATTLRLDGDLHSLGHHVRHQLREHLRSGAPPRTALSAPTLAALRASLTEKKIDLPVWRFRTDPQDAGRAGNWHLPATDSSTAEWRDLKAGSHWENQAEDLRHFTGVAWYRLDVAIPADWQDLPVQAVFEGVDDSFELWLNGEPAGSFGDPATKSTIWLERQVAPLGTRLKAGATNTLVLRVVDHAGSGGLWKPVFLTTGPTDARSRLLH